ncbi:hypothetical protein CA54_12650 [Symmachiella macrocystis]|uniref:DUF8091 domain-containing protein n=1 Tax=Symmachiella macrocystis TaxID=2527985 RepID=A0A5C6BLW1_9PLAN|nr:hypothetical protein [Symmachiella macrocystis]TWU12441.1 hypothetical protein CA54_12650 [Symmachiella macrocystis]
METSLHRQLKSLYCTDESQQEVTLAGYRIDGIVDEMLIEIQCASLGAIRDKIRALTKKHDVIVVKPLAARKQLVKYDRKRGKIISRRASPKRETFHDLFLELVHFVNVFPHPRLTLEVLLTEQQEHRLPPLKSRRTRKKYRVQDRSLERVVSKLVLRTNNDLLTMLPPDLPTEFTTADIARGSEIPRWLAQKMAYCLRKTGAVSTIGKQGNAMVYQCEQTKREKTKRKAA